MFKIEDTNILITRGDKAIIGLELDDYTFSVGDIVEFKLYNKYKMNNSPIFYKKITVEEETNEVSIELTSEETKIDEMANVKREYWYEIVLNNDTTVLGYDQNGAKKLILYPEGADVDAS